MEAPVFCSLLRQIALRRKLQLGEREAAAYTPKGPTQQCCRDKTALISCAKYSGLFEEAEGLTDGAAVRSATRTEGSTSLSFV